MEEKMTVVVEATCDTCMVQARQLDSAEFADWVLLLHEDARFHYCSWKCALQGVTIIAAVLAEPQ
jgi:3-phenylpropionate/cinnamic acid dioxygenase small subunit